MHGKSELSRQSRWRMELECALLEYATVQREGGVIIAMSLCTITITINLLCGYCYWYWYWH